MLLQGLFVIMTVSLASVSHVSALSDESRNSPFRDARSERYVRYGDVVLGGLFPLHHFNETAGECDKMLSMSDLKMVEAMVFAIDRINANESILPGVTLGFEIYDTCLTPTITLENALNFLPSQKAFDCKGPKERFPCSRPAVGVVGAERSSSTIQASSLLQVYRIPQISYMATIKELSNIRKYPYFLRTVPPDYIQGQVILDILLHFEWSFISAVHSDDIYGHSGFTTFRRLAEDRGVCFGTVLEVSASYGDAEWNRVVHQLLRYTNATVVVLFAQREEVEMLLNVAARNADAERLTWLATNGWGSYCLQPINSENEKAAYGALLVAPYAEKCPEFDEYFSSIVASQSDNPWLTDYLVHHFNCIPGQSTAPNSGQVGCDDPKLMTTGEETSMESLIINAVLAFAYSLNKIQVEQCTTEDPLCWELNPLWQTIFMRHLLNSSFHGPTGQVSFNEVGDSYGKYFIRNVQRKGDGGYECAEVGLWEEGRDWMNGKLEIFSDIQFYRNGTWFFYDWDSRNGTAPVSVCSQPCGEGEIQSVIEEMQCCWICSPCQEWEIIRSQGTLCMACHTYTWPNENRTKCELIEPSYLQDFAPAIASLLTVFNSLGILATGLTSVCYVRNHNVRLIKASGRELCYLILIGIIYSFIMSYFYITPPSDTMCFLRRFSYVGYSLIFGALATKTNRVYRIFRSGKKSALKPRFISPKSQITITMMFVTVQLVLSLGSIVCVFPESHYSMPLSTMKFVEIRCLDCVFIDVLRLTWNCLLLIISLYQGLKTRKLPHNYNESKFITLCVFGAFVVGVSAIPAYALTSLSVFSTLYKISVFICIGYMSLIFLFFPKLYAIYFVSEDKITIEDSFASNQSPSTWDSGRDGRPNDENAGKDQPTRRHTSIDSGTDIKLTEADGRNELTSGDSIERHGPLRASKSDGKRRPSRVLPATTEVDDVCGFDMYEN
ncbi:metabotropic glutamate receptor 2-like [Ptychodera flava]|uniref:metabotropic glutamate receptor 2-like n=1 Tax=Ptychodera flava TaxID=63121 RepID=UPI00396A29C9